MRQLPARRPKNTPKPQLNATTEAATAAIIRRKLGNIAPRNEGPRATRKKHASQRARDHREGEGFSVDDSPLDRRSAEGRPVPVRRIRQARH
jgi:hypothetical protein